MDKVTEYSFVRVKKYFFALFIFYPVRNKVLIYIPLIPLELNSLAENPHVPLYNLAYTLSSLSIISWKTKILRFDRFDKSQPELTSNGNLSGTRLEELTAEKLGAE